MQSHMQMCYVTRLECTARSKGVKAFRHSSFESYGMDHWEPWQSRCPTMWRASRGEGQKKYHIFASIALFANFFPSHFLQVTRIQEHGGDPRKQKPRFWKHFLCREWNNSGLHPGDAQPLTSPMHICLLFPVPFAATSVYDSSSRNSTRC